MFLIGKDFCPSMELQPGIKAEAGNQLRPYNKQGVSGIIPQTKMNYCELAASTGLSKDACREMCELVFKRFSDDVRRGQPVTK